VVCGKFSWRMRGWLAVSRRLPPAGSSGGSLRSTPATPSTKVPEKLATHGGRLRGWVLAVAAEAARVWRARLA